MTKLFTSLAQKAVRALASPTLLLFALPWLMALLVLGTVAQRYLGLFASEKLFFGSFILWLGPIPAPGAYTVLALMALSLIAKLAFYSPLEKSQSGIILTHISVLVLLAGGLVSALCREEGYIVLKPGESSNRVSDYHARELVILKNNAPFAALAYEALHEGQMLQPQGLPFSLTVQALCYPCAARPRITNDGQARGAAQKLELTATRLSNEDADNQPGVSFIIQGAGKDQDGSYIAYEGLAEQPIITQSADHYEIRLRPQLRALPFSVSLSHFEKADYPGTDMARSYLSDVTVKDESGQWSDRIEMNHPLRYRGYTLYQSSFGNADGTVYTVLAVVKNAGQLFPYISIGMLCAGLLLHMALRLLRKDET